MIKISYLSMIYLQAKKIKAIKNMQKMYILVKILFILYMNLIISSPLGNSYKRLNFNYYSVLFDKILIIKKPLAQAQFYAYT